jgi:hypothetical protein
MLSYYATRFSTAEIKNTLHKFPGTVLTVRWMGELFFCRRLVNDGKYNAHHSACDRH